MIQKALSKIDNYIHNYEGNNNRVSSSSFSSSKPANDLRSKQEDTNNRALSAGSCMEEDYEEILQRLEQRQHQRDRLYKYSDYVYFCFFLRLSWLYYRKVELLLEEGADDELVDIALTHLFASSSTGMESLRPHKAESSQARQELLHNLLFSSQEHYDDLC